MESSPEFCLVLVCFMAFFRVVIILVLEFSAGDLPCFSLFYGLLPGGDY
jgi:hypothetical protein